MPSFPLKTTTHIIVACMALHNFIRRTDTGDREFLLFDENVDLEYNVDAHNTTPEDVTWEEPTQQSVRQMERVRDAIRDGMPTTI